MSLPIVNDLEFQAFIQKNKSNIEPGTMSRSLTPGSLRQKDFCKFEVRLPYIHSEFQASQAVYKILSQNNSSDQIKSWTILADKLFGDLNF